jgi:hypothetical protein
MKEKFKKILKTLLIMVGLLAVFGATLYYIQFSPPSFYYQKEIKDYTTPGKIYTFKDIKLASGEDYQLGFSYGKIKRPAAYVMKNDGNYTIEYYNSRNKLVHKAVFNRHYHELGFSSKQGRYFRSPFDHIKVPLEVKPGYVTIKLTAHTPLSILTKLHEKNHPIEFFIREIPDDEKRSFKKKIVQSDKISITGIPLKSHDYNTTKKLLLHALFSKDLAQVKTIIEADNGINVNTLIEMKKSDIYRYRVQRKRTPIIYAAYFNDIPTLKYLISKGANLDHKDCDYQNALGYAIMNNSLEAVKVLLASGSKLKDVAYVYTTKQQDYTTPLYAAVGNNAYEMTKLLLEHGSRGEQTSTKIRYNQGADPYRYLYDIEDYKRILTLLLKYNIHSTARGRIENRFLEEVYNDCTKPSYIAKSVLDNMCIPIRDNNLSLQDMNLHVYFDMKNKPRRKKLYEQQQTAEEKK